MVQKTLSVIGMCREKSISLANVDENLEEDFVSNFFNKFGISNNIRSYSRHCSESHYLSFIKILRKLFEKKHVFEQSKAKSRNKTKAVTERVS